MPSRRSLESRLPSIPLTIPQLRILRELAGGAALRQAEIEVRAGAAGLAGLVSMGYIIDERLPVEGVLERVWQITDTGHAALACAALPARGVRHKSKVEKNGTDPAPRLGALVPWFGSARRYAGAVGEACRGRAWVGVPFAGSLAEIPAILDAGAGAVAVNDRHRHLINLARVAADPVLGMRLYRRLRRQPFNEEVLRDAQRHCRASEPGGDRDGSGALDLDLAFWYFICAWAGRSGLAGTGGELRCSLAMRWSATGGDSALRFSGACWSLRAWRRLLARCTITCLDAFDFLARVADDRRSCVYADPPWPGPGDSYVHGFGEAEHRRLAAVLGGYQRVRAVVRSGGGPLAREIYPPDEGWEWRQAAGRNQGNRAAAEYLIARNGD